jgi:ADP-heptose:LPS heptosyltransferase
LIGPLGERGLRHIVLIGAPTERPQVQQIVDREPSVIDLVGRASVGQTMAVIDDAALVIANDSAPLHMAVGFERPCVGLYGPTDPAAVGPWGADHAVVRAGGPEAQPGGPEAQPGRRFRDPKLGDALMRLINVADVLQRVDCVMDRAATGGGEPAAADHARVPERAAS